MNILSFPFLLPFTEKTKALCGMAAFRGTGCVPARRPHHSSTGWARALCAALGVWDANRQWQSSIWAISASSASWKASRKPKHNPTTRHGVDQGRPLLRCVWQGPFPYLAETLVVKETQSFENVSGVVPVMSSHCAGEVPPVQTHAREISFQTLSTHRLHKEYLCLTHEKRI